MTTENPYNKDLITEEPGSHPVGTGVGALAGVATGAAAGAIAGPAGVIIGAVAGGIAGGLAGHHIGEGVNPTEGLISDDENAVGTGVGSAAGAIVGGIAGTVGGPLGTAAGAALGAGVGGYLGGEAEDTIDNKNLDTHDVNNKVFVDRINHRDPIIETPVLRETDYVETKYIPQGNPEPFRGDIIDEDRPLDERDYK